ncbi:MAG: hypothetical protein HOH74_30655 [Gemmatimonadetes bacterium]|nr:hypothetical protein [Gemmatimonadota bacterium]
MGVRDDAPGLALPVDLDELGDGNASGLDEILRVDDLIFARYALRGSVEEPPLEWNPT